MDYKLHYDRLITRARTRTLYGYKEWHHVVPHGINEESVALTAEENYVAHQLLVRMYPEGPDLTHITTIIENRHGRRGGNKFYGWFKKRIAKNHAKVMSRKVKEPHIWCRRTSDFQDLLTDDQCREITIMRNIGVSFDDMIEYYNNEYNITISQATLDGIYQREYNREDNISKMTDKIIEKLLLKFQNNENHNSIFYWLLSNNINLPIEYLKMIYLAKRIQNTQLEGVN
jgi:hypothetical protein